MLAKFDFNQIGQTNTPLMTMLRKYMGRLTIDSKETGVGPLKLYNSQKLALEQIALGLKNGIHHFTTLKGRQLGISTAFLGIDCFWLSVFPGTQGALVIDDEGNRDQFRNIITRYLQGMPKEFRVKIKTHSRNQLTLTNGSILYYLIAGTKKKGSFGHGRGINFVHATELSRYGDPEAWASFVSALAETHPNRLYLYESTARGYNLFHEVWEEAIESPEKVALFLGWWTKETYKLKKGGRLYNHHMDTDYTPEEIEKIGLVKQQYGVDITDEQVAWYRWKSRELMSGDEGYVEQEFPWTAEEAFQLTGKLFFPLKQVNLQFRRAQEQPFAGFRYHMGDTFDAIEIEKTKTIPDSELRVWEPPSKFGTYSVGADPAYGTSIEGNSWKDRFAITVNRCFADKVVQVAEYAADDIAPYKFAWVIAHLCGWYRNTRLVLEINGPGAAVLSEFKHVQRELQSGHRASFAKERGINNVLAQMSHYLYQRQDSFASSNMLHFKATSESKGLLMRRAKDALILNSAVVNSTPMLREMQKVVDKDGFIGAEGRGKDDRTLAWALSYKGYDDWLRAPLSAGNQTYATVMAKEAADMASPKATFQTHILDAFWRKKELERAGLAHPPGVWKFEIKDKVGGI